MKRIGFLFVCFLWLGFLCAQDISLRGENNAVFIYRATKDSLSNYFEDEFKLRIDRGVFTFGMSFKAELPKYRESSPISELNPSQIITQWQDRYVQLSFDDLRLRGGTIEEAFGVGLMLRAWNDTDNNFDKRLEGAQVAYFNDQFRLATVYGGAKYDLEEVKINKDDIIAGSDFEYKLFDQFQIGASAVQYKQKNWVTSMRSYTNWDLFGGRISFNSDLFDLNAEYAELLRYHNTHDQNGTALYGQSSIYIHNFTFTGGYKKYARFKYPYADLPTLNHYDELLYNYGDINYEEGLLGEIKFQQSVTNEYILNYSEAWNDDFKVRYANAYFNYTCNLEQFMIITELETVERNDEYQKSWEKEIIPSITTNFFHLSVPLQIKFQYAMNSEEDLNYITNINTQKKYHKPYLQIDSTLYNWFSYSIFAQYQIDEGKEMMKNKVYLGTEVIVNVAKHTELKLFVGKEKGGKVCRNGVCKYQPPFEGLKLSLNTRF